MKKFTVKEIIELKYVFEKGFKYIAKGEDGTPGFYKKKPIRYRYSTCYEIWIIEGNYPIENHSEYRDTELSNYGSILWTDEPVSIADIIKQTPSESILADLCEMGLNAKDIQDAYERYVWHTNYYEKMKKCEEAKEVNVLIDNLNECPVCGNITLDKNNYCPSCGQKLKYSKL